jgi:hypothetical protein
MVDAEKRLLANALEDVDNQVFILLSDRFGWLHKIFLSLNFDSMFTNVFYDSCVPLHAFDYIYNYLMGTNISFIDW